MIARAVPALRLWFAALLVLALAPLTALAQAGLQPIPALSGPVVDTTGTLSPAATQALSQKIEAIRQTNGAQVQVAIVPTTQPEAIEDYSMRLATAWKIGRGRAIAGQDVDDGVILLVAKNDRSLRIEVGYGLEGAINDALAGRIIREQIAPRFKADDFDGGVTAGVDAIIGRIQGEELPPPVPEGAGSSVPTDLLGRLVMGFMIGFFAASFFGVALRAVLGKTLGGLVTGGMAGGFGWFILGAPMIGIIAGVIAAILVPAMATLPAGGSGWSRGRGGSGWGSGGGWSGGGGGGGGWSGGGGGFGGGGASGRW